MASTGHRKEEVVTFKVDEELAKAHQDLTHILFGNILVASFDPAHSVAIGLSPTMIRYILLFLLAMTTVVAIQTVGVILVLSLLVTPAAAASMLSKRLGAIIGLSVILSVVATIVGFYFSFYSDLASGPAIVLLLIFFFILAFTWSVIRDRMRGRKSRPTQHST